MKKTEERFLPIGTVVMLKGGTKRLMITGFYSMDVEKKDRIWDYNGCLYPEGILSSDETALFNHEQIEKVYHMGLEEDEEEKKFKKSLKEAIKEQEAQNTAQETTDMDGDKE